MASNNPFALLTEPTSAFAPPEQDAAPANPFEGLAAYSTAPEKAPRGTKMPGSVNGTEPIRWITINGHPIPIKAPSGADHMLPVPGNSNVLQDPQTKEHYFKTPNAQGGFDSIWDTQRKVHKDGKIISHVKGVGDKEWGDDPKVAERAQKTQEAADKKEQKDVTATAAADTKEVLQQAAIPVTTAKETLAHQDKLFTVQVTKAQTRKKLSAGVATSTQNTANEAFSALKTHVETNHTAGEGSQYKGLDEDGITRFKKLKLKEGTSEDQYKSKEAELRQQYKDAQATANAAKRVDDENKRFVATAYFHKQAWATQSRPLREGLKQTQYNLSKFKEAKLLTEGTASRLQSNEEQVRTTWPLKTNTGRNADGSARPPQITPPPDFNQYNPEAPQPTQAQMQAAGRDVIAEHMDISGLPPMPRISIAPTRFGLGHLPTRPNVGGQKQSENSSLLAMPEQLPVEGFLPGKPIKDPNEPDDATKEARASVLKGLQNANRGMAYNVTDKPITWDKNTLKHDGQPVGKISKDEFGTPSLYIDHGHDGQKVSPSLNSGHYYDGIPELSSPSPAHLEEFKTNGVTKPEDVQKAWGQRHWSTSDLNDLVDQWTSSNDDERQDLIAQTNPSQADVAKGQRRLNTRELYKDGQISAQDARMLDHAFYGRKPGVDDPAQSFEQFKNSDHPDAGALASFAHDNTTLNPIAAGASQDAYGRALSAWSADYLKRNATSPDFDRRAFIAARDKLLQPLGQRASAWLDKTTQGLVGVVPALAEQPVNVGLGLVKDGATLALEKAGVTSPMFKDMVGQLGSLLTSAATGGMAPAGTDAPAMVGIHPHDAQEQEMVRQGSQGFGNSFMSFLGDHANLDTVKALAQMTAAPASMAVDNPAAAFAGKNGAKVQAASKELFDAIDSESMTPAKLKELSVRLRDASIELHGISNFDATNQTGYDYNGRYDVSDPRSPLAQALAGYAETADPSYKEMFKQALATSEGGDALAQKMSEYLQAHGHIAGTPVGAAMSWLNRLSGGALHYDNPDAWRALSESAGNTVQPLQVMAIQEALGATSALPGLLKGAATPILKSTGRALLASGELANGASSVAKVLQKISTIPYQDAIAQKAGSVFGRQLATSAAHGAGFMALQQPGMGIGQSMGDVAQAGAEGAGIGAVAGSFNAAARALDIRRTNAAQNKAHEDFVGHWNQTFPHNPITIADSRQASHYMGPEEAPRLQQIRTLADQFAVLKDKVAARTATREEFEQLKPLRLQIDNLFVAQQHAMDGAIAATQEINGIADPNLKGWANAALKQLSGNPLTPVEEAAMTSAVTGNGLPLSTPKGDGTHTITDAGLATIEQVAPATRRAYFPSDETSQTTTPNEQPTSAQPVTETAPAPGDPSQKVTKDLSENQSEGSMGEGMGGSPQETGRTGQIRRADSESLSGSEKPTEGSRTTGIEPPELVRQTDTADISGRVEAPPEKVNPAPNSPEPATQAEPARPQSDTQPVTPKDTEVEAAQHMQATGSQPSPKHVRNFLAKAGIAFGHTVVDFGVLPKAIKENLGMPGVGRAIEKVVPTFQGNYGAKDIHNWGTQWVDKTMPGSNLGQWMDGLKRVNPEVYDFLHNEAHTNIGLHRMWFGHDPLANFAEVAKTHGFSALPDFALQLFKDSLTKSGIPMPGMQWLWESKLMDGHRTRDAADWMSLNFGEAAAKGIAIASTFKLYRDLGKGKQIHDGWAAVGSLVKVVAGVTYHDPVLILTGLADIPPIIASLSHKGVVKAFKAFDGLVKQSQAKKETVPAEKKLQGFKPQTDIYADSNTPLDGDQNLTGRMVSDNTEGTSERSGSGVLGGQTPTRSGESSSELDAGKQVDPQSLKQTSTSAQPTGIPESTPAGKTGNDEDISSTDLPTVDYRGIARQQIEDQLKDSPVLRDLVEVHEDVPEDMQSAGGMALTREGGIRVALPQLEEQLRGMTPEEAKSHVAKVLDEEVRHVAHIKAARLLYDQKKATGETGKLGFGQWMSSHYGKMWAEFSPEQQQAVRDAYGKTLDAQPDANKAMEALRIISQRRATGDQSETSMLWQKLPQVVLEHLKAVFDYLKNLSKQKLTPALEQELSGIEQVLKEHNYGQKAEEVADHPAMVELRKSNEELPAAAQKLWTPEVYARAADFYKTGEVKALDGLTVIQKRRITAAGVKSSPEALAKEAAAEKVIRQSEADDKRHMRATTEPDLQTAPIKRTTEEIEEMMKGLPAEERAKIALDNNLTAPKNAVIEEMQERLGMPATQKIAALKEKEVDELAKRKLATNPDAPRTILNEFSHSGKAMSAADVRVLGKESGRIYSRLKEIEDLREKASPEERTAMATESRELRPYLDELYQAINHTGTLSSDALRSRKYLEELNHSEAGIKQALRNAFGGRDITPAEEATVAKEAEELSKAYIAVERQKAIEDAPKVSAALQRAVTDASKPISAPTQRTVSSAALKQIKSRAAKARELLARSAMEPAQSAPLKSAPPKLSAEKLAAYADIAAEHLLEGRNISDELVKEYPDSRAHLSEIITEAKKVHAAILAETAKVEQAKAAKAAAKLDPKNIMAAAHAGEYGDEISPQWMHELAMAHIVDAHKDGGTPTEGDIIKRMVKDVKTLFPDAGEREVREALVEYGKISQPNPEEMATELRQLKRISRLVLSKEDASEGTAPPKSQIRDKQSPEERQMRRELARIMDEHNVERQDPERALASRRDRLKSSLQNQIEDLQRIIDAKAKPERKLGKVMDDAEIKQLKARKQALVDQVNAMDSVKAATEAQRVETAIRAAKASQMEWERKLKDQEIIAKKTKTPEAVQAVIEARAQRDAAREAYSDMVDAKDMHLPGALFKEAERKLEAAKKRETDIRDKILNGDTSTPEGKPAFTTPELEAQKAVNAGLNKELAKMRSEVEKAQRVADKARGGNLPGDLFKRAEAQLKAAEKREAELQTKLAKGDLKVKEIAGRFKTPKLEQAQARVKALNEQMAKLRKEAPRTPEQEAKARAVYLRRNDTRIAEVERRIREQDFAPKAKKDFPHDDMTLKSQVLLGQANLKMKQAIRAKEHKDRKWPEKAMDKAVKIRRAWLLSGGVVLGKLSAAAAVRMATTPIEEAVGGVLHMIPGIRTISKQAPRHGGAFNPLREIRATVGGLKIGLKDLWEVEGAQDGRSILRTGKSAIDLAYDKAHHYDLDRSLFDWFGNLHATLKNPVKQAEFLRSYEKLALHAARKGEDVSDPAVKLRIGTAAYAEAKGAIFMNDHRLATGFNNMVQALEHSKKLGRGGKVGATALRILLPIVKVPTNIASETAELAGGALVMALYRTAREIKNGKFNDMDPQAADAIMRSLKKGSIGAALLAYGILHHQQFGGYYHAGQPKDEDAPGPHHIKIDDYDVPGWMTHAPLFEVMHFGADATRVAQSIDKETGQPMGTTMGGLYATSGLLNSIPFLQSTRDATKLFDTGTEADKSRGRFVSGLVIPQGIKEIADLSDTDEHGEHQTRNPKTIPQYIKAGVPMVSKDTQKKLGLDFTNPRETVPLKGAFSGLGSPPPPSNVGSPPVTKHPTTRRPHAPTRRH